MPNNVPWSPVIAILFFFGLPVMKVINRVTYLTIENGIFATLTVVENNLDLLWLRKTADIEVRRKIFMNARSARSRSTFRSSGGNHTAGPATP